MCDGGGGGGVVCSFAKSWSVQLYALEQRSMLEQCVLLPLSSASLLLYL
jgi:hypothetical protein